MIHEIPEELAVELLKKAYNAAAFVLNDPDKLQALRQSVSSTSIGFVQEFMQWVQEYSQSNLSFESEQWIVAALLYVQSKKDFIPDTDSELGLVDDYAVLKVCKKIVMKQENEK